MFFNRLLTYDAGGFLLVSKLSGRRIMDEMLISRYFSNRFNALDVLSLILQKIKNKEPLSLIRLGDGEGRLMGYPELVPKEQADDSDGDHKYLNYSLNIWFGRSDFDVARLQNLSSQLRQAVLDADVVGLPREKQFNAHGAYRLVFQAIDRFDLRAPHHIYTDAAIHRYLQFGLFYTFILNDLDFLGLVTGRQHLGVIVRETFNIKHVESYLVPEEANYSSSKVAEHFPARFKELKKDIKVPYKGAVFLVGAGALGKIYCSWIKQAGGIAIDIGCICDSWSSEGRSMHRYNNIEHYQNQSFNSADAKIKRFNQIIEEFNIDTDTLVTMQLDGMLESVNHEG